MMTIRGSTLILSVIGILCWTNVHADLYAALTQLEDLIETINVLHKILKNYIQLQENRLNLLKRYALSVADEVQKANEDPEEYLSNPINGYLLIKRLTADWNVTKSLMFDDFYQVELRNNITIQLKGSLFPSDEDLRGAGLALIRLQDTYQFDTKSIIHRELNGISNATELACDDCFLLGKISYETEYYNLMYSWMTESLLKCESDEQFTTLYKWKILDYMAFGSYIAGNDLMALNLTYELLKVHPEYKTIMKDFKLYEKLSDNWDNHTKMGDVSENIIFENQDDDDIVRYKQLCSRRAELPVNISSQLRCRYVNYGKPFLMLAPLKEEEAYLNPRILLFRQVLYPSEIEKLKILASPKLKRAAVYVNESKKTLTSDSRISKSGWLNKSDDQMLQTLDRRVADMTSLSIESAEDLQVANYGIGGHFIPHYDYFYIEDYDNRIGTVLFYLNTVKQGGATAFPHLDLALWPEEGSAVFWHNLHTSGAYDERTFHGACPVLQGSKWAANKWLRQSGQEFLRPCHASDL